MKYLLILLLCVGCADKCHTWGERKAIEAQRYPEGSVEHVGLTTIADILTHGNDIVFAQQHYPEVTQQVWQIVLQQRKFSHTTDGGYHEPPHRIDNDDMTQWDISCEVLLYIRTHPKTVGEIEIAARASR